MAKIIHILLIIVLNFNLSNQESVSFDSEKLPKCDCAQRTDNFQQIPLFNIDCSRLNMEVFITNNILPLYTGRLDFSHNEITHLNESFKLVSNTIYYLDLSYNRLQNISENYFNDLNHLIYLNLAHNSLKTINNVFSGLVSLKILNLQSNQIKILPEISLTSLSSLEELNLNNNNLGDFVQGKKLINYLPNKVKNLYLDSIRLKNISRSMFEDMTRLKKLSIAYNPFTDLPYLSLNDLEYLDISGTKLNNITTKSLTFPYLKILKMNRLIHITKIYDYAFFNLHNLEELYIEHCINLEEIERVSFGYVKDEKLALKKFSVAYSGLKYLPESFKFIFQDLEEVFLRGNFWDCDCKLVWLTHLKKTVQDTDFVRCYSPESQANKTIFSMKEDEFSCFQTKRIISESGAPIKSWLFPLIGVLTIIIFILVAILIYMGPYGKNIYRMEGKMIGPDSPYSPISIYPNNAEEFKA